MKNIGAVNGLYPMPVTVVGTEIEGKVNWINIAHVGIIGVDNILLSMGKAHYSNQGIKENQTVSINLVNEEMMVRADFVGSMSGKNTDKSEVFEFFGGELDGAPLIKEAPIAMECEVVGIFETETHDNFIVKPVNTYVNEAVLTDDGSIDYEKVRPIVFEMPNRQYLSVGKAVGKCWNIGRQYKS